MSLKRPGLVLSLGLIALTLVCYLFVLRCDFFNMDDPFYVQNNPPVLGGLTWANLAWAFTTLYLGYWQPITWLSFQADASLFGAQAWGFHLTNLAIHLANTVLVFCLLRKITGTTWRSALVAALFALHPMHVESVAWITERKDVLSTLFGLLALWAYAAYAARPNLGSYALVFLWLFLGLASKPMLVTWPVLFLLLDYWPLRRAWSAKSGTPPDWRRLLLEKAPFFLLAAAFSVITIVAQKQWGTMASLTSLSFTQRLGNAVFSYWKYLELTFWPVGLGAYYPHPFLVGQESWAMIGMAGLGLLAVSAGIVWLRSPPLLMGWGWFLVTFLPVIGLFQAGDQGLADRFSYVPHLGLFIGLVWAGADLGQRFAVESRVAVCGVLVLLLAGLTWMQVRHWQNSFTLWSHTVQVTQHNYVGWRLLGEQYYNRGNGREAENCLRKAIAIHQASGLSPHPNLLKAHVTLGGVLAGQGRLEEAAQQFEQALVQDPNDIDARYNLGSLLLDMGKRDQGEKLLLQLANEPWDNLPKEGLFFQGMAFLLLERPEDAAERFRQALQQDAAFSAAMLQLAVVLLTLDRPHQALDHAARAVDLAPSGAAFNALGIVLSRLGKNQQALGCFDQATRLEPMIMAFRCNLAFTLYLEGHKDRALAEYKNVLAASPTWPKEASARARYLALEATPAGRDSLQAVELALQACQATNFQEVSWSTVLAEVLAAVPQTQAERAQAMVDRTLQVLNDPEVRRRLSAIGK